MCLDKITRKSNLAKTGVMWKVFDDYGGELEFEFYNEPKAMRGKWLTSTDEELFATNGIYEGGFHGFVRKRDAKTWADQEDEKVIVKVKFRNAVAKGTQFGQDVLVAKEIYIPK